MSSLRIGRRLRLVCSQQGMLWVLLLALCCFAHPAEAGSWNISVAYSGSYSVNSSGSLQCKIVPAGGGNISGGSTSTSGGITGSFTQVLVVGAPQSQSGWLPRGVRACQIVPGDFEQEKRLRLGR